MLGDPKIWRGPHLHLGKCSIEAKIQLQGCHKMTLLDDGNERNIGLHMWNVFTTAKLVRTARISHPRVIGGICVTQASIPTGILQVCRRLVLRVTL